MLFSQKLQGFGTVASSDQAPFTKSTEAKAGPAIISFAKNPYRPYRQRERGTGSQKLSVASKRDYRTPLDCHPLLSDRKNRWTFRLRNANVSAVQNYYGGLPI